MTKPTKPMYKTLKVMLDNGSTVQIKRCTLENLDTLLNLQDELLERYVRSNGYIGEFITDESVRANLLSMCNLLPIVSTKDPIEYLDFTTIEDNWEQLILLFFNGSLNEDSRELDNVTTASLVSQLHFFPYLTMLQKHVEQKAKEEEKRKS
jgi:hypothetical protein